MICHMESSSLAILGADTFPFKDPQFVTSPLPPPLNNFAHSYYSEKYSSPCRETTWFTMKVVRSLKVNCFMYKTAFPFILLI